MLNKSKFFYTLAAGLFVLWSPVAFAADFEIKTGEGADRSYVITDARDIALLSNLVGTCSGVADFWYEKTAWRFYTDLEVVTQRIGSTFLVRITEQTNMHRHSGYASVEDGKVRFPYGPASGGALYEPSGGNGVAFKLFNPKFTGTNKYGLEYVAKNTTIICPPKPPRPPETASR